MNRCELTYAECVGNDSGQCVVCHDWTSNHAHNLYSDESLSNLHTVDNVFTVTWAEGLGSVALAAYANARNGADVQRDPDGNITLVVDGVTTMVLNRI